jgi:hypothetical protein
VERGAGALFVGTRSFTNSHREAIVVLAPIALFRRSIRCANSSRSTG